MAIVVEVQNRSGGVIQTQTFDSNKVSIGRGLNNDFIVHDQHADATHLCIEQGEATHNFYCEDQNTLNGVWLLMSKLPSRAVSLKGQSRLHGRKLFYSGQQFLVGRTIVRVFSSEHPVAPTLAFSRWEQVVATLSHWWVWLTALVATVALQSYGGYLNNPIQGHFFQYLLPSAYVVFGALFYAGVWGFIGKNLKHESRFAAQFSLALLAVLAIGLLDWLMPILIYNLKLWWVKGVIDELVGATIVFVMLLLTLLFATALKPVTRFFVALVIPVGLLLSFVISGFTQDDFKPTPSYETALVAPPWQWRRVVERTAFLQHTQQLYAEYEHPSDNKVMGAVTAERARGLSLKPGN